LFGVERHPRRGQEGNPMHHALSFKERGELGRGQKLMDERHNSVQRLMLGASELH
jgi:hypothetical protein